MAFLENINNLVWKKMKKKPSLNCKIRTSLINVLCQNTSLGLSYPLFLTLTFRVHYYFM